MSHSVIGTFCTFLIASHLEWLQLYNLFWFLSLPLSYFVTHCSFTLSLPFSIFVSCLLLSFCCSLSLTFLSFFSSLFFCVHLPPTRSNNSSSYNPSFKCPDTSRPTNHTPINKCHPTATAPLQLPRFIALTLITIPQQQMHDRLSRQVFLSR